MNKSTTPRPVRVTAKRWDSWLGCMVDVPASKCVECGMVSTAKDGARHYADCLILEIKESFQ